MINESDIKIGTIFYCVYSKHVCIYYIISIDNSSITSIILDNDNIGSIYNDIGKTCIHQKYSLKNKEYMTI